MLKNKYDENIINYLIDYNHFVKKETILKIKDENYYFYILWLLQSKVIKYFLKKTKTKLIKKTKDILIIENIPIPHFKKNTPIAKKIIELVKNKDLEELDKYVMMAYNVFSDIDKQIITDFWRDNLEENINDNELKEYWDLFAETFWNSRAWIIMKRQKIIWENIDFKYWNDKVLWLSWMCFSFNNWKIDEEVFDLIKKGRIYLPEKKYLFIIKPNKKKYWTLSNAYKDALYENDLIFKNIKIQPLNI